MRGKVRITVHDGLIIIYILKLGEDDLRYELKGRVIGLRILNM